MSATSSVRELKAEDFDAEVLQCSKPVLVDFYTEHCGACRILAPLLESLAAEHGEEVSVLKTDAGQSPELAARFNVRSVPTLIFFQDGQMKSQHTGTLSKDGMLRRLKG